MSESVNIVTCKWLREQLNNPEVVLFDCRFDLNNPELGYQQYLNNHIPGAYYLHLDKDLSATVSEHGGRHPLPAPEQIGSKLAAMGVKWGQTKVIAYDDSRFAFAARLWWLLRYLGHQQVFILDGGWKAWSDGQYRVTDAIPTPVPGEFFPDPQPDMVVDIVSLKTRKDMPGVVLVDSRDSDRYRGEREPIDPIAGHIPGAVNSPWKQVTDLNGYCKPISFQESLWTDFQQAEEIIVYCGSGVTACVNLLSLELVGIRNVKLYTGGWSDWCSYLT